MPYRVDPEAIDRERARLAERVHDLESRWTETFWRAVAPAREIAQPGSRKRERSSEAEVARLAARLEHLEALERDAARILDEWETPPPLDEPRTVMTGSSLSFEPRMVRNSLERAIEQMGEIVEHEAGPLPVGVRARVHHTESGAYLVVHLVSAVARGVSELTVRHESMFDEVRKLFGSKHDIQIGVDAFDGVFAIEGDEPTARAVLDAEVRAALLRMGTRGPVDVRVGSCRSYVGSFTSMNGHVDPGWLRSAVTVTCALYRAPARPLRA